MDHFSLYKSCDTKFQNLVSFKLLLYRTSLKTESSLAKSDTSM